MKNRRWGQYVSRTNRLKKGKMLKYGNYLYAIHALAKNIGFPSGTNIFKDRFCRGKTM
jgi:hypothetical protein